MSKRRDENIVRALGMDRQSNTVIRARCGIVCEVGIGAEIPLLGARELQTMTETCDEECK